MPDIEQEVLQLEKQIARLDQREKRAKAAYLDGIDTKEEYKEIKQQCEVERLELHTKLSNLKASEITDVLLQYKLISSRQIEMDDETQTVYHFRPTPSFIALLIFAREIIDKPSVFTYQQSIRQVPYLK